MAQTDRRYRVDLRRQNPKMVRALITPEGADLAVVYADAGTRASAFILDAVIMIAAMVAVTIIILIGLFRYGKSAGEAMAITWLIFFFFVRNFYFVLFEGGSRGATPGKRISRIRVISRDGTGLRIDQVIARNLMREIEVFLPLSMLMARASSGVADTGSTLLGLAWALLFTLFPLFNRDRLRIGDLLAGTAAIHAPRRALLEDLSAHVSPAMESYRFTARQLDAYGIAELQKLEEVLRGDNDEALWIVARAIEGKIGWSSDIRDARPFLMAYYSGLRAHLERGVLLGNRRADKRSR